MSNLLFQDTKMNILQIKSNNKYSIVAAGQNGIRWIDNSRVTTIQSAKISLTDGDQVNAIALTADSNYLLANFQQKLSLFSVNSKDFSLKLVRQSSNQIAITDIYLIANDKIAVIIGEKGSVIAYDIQSKSTEQEILILNQFNSQTNILGFIQISQNYEWIYVADQFAGVTILKLTLVENSDGTIKSFSMIKAGSIGQLYFVAQVEVTSDNKYLYAFDKWYGIQIVQLDSIMNADSTSYPIVITQKKLFWPYYDMNPVFMGTKISIDSNYLVVAVRSHGLIIFDIRDKMNPIFYYKIQIEGIPIWIEFSPSQQQIFYTDGQEVLVYQQVEPNLNDDFPNMFNGHQSSLTIYTQAYYQWRCYLSADQQFMFAAQCGDVDVLKIDNNDPYTIKPFFKIPKQGSSRTCNLEFSSDYTQMYQPINTSGRSIDIFNLKNLDQNSQNLQLLQSYLNATPQRNEDIRFSNDQNILVMTFAQGIQIIDSTDKLNLKLISSWQVPLAINGFPCSVGVSPNNKWIIIGMRSVGTYIVLDISDITQPKQAQSLVTLGGEQVVISKIYNIAYLCDGSKGLAIIDLDYLPAIKELSRISIDGWANQAQLIKEEQFIVISSMDYGMLTVVNIQNKSNPIIFSKYQENTQQSFGNCFFNDLTYGFSVSQYGLRIFPMKSQVKIHSSFIDISSSNKIPQEIDKDANLLVGQTIQLQLLMLYSADGAQIMDVFYYSNYQMNQLPYWINFIKSKNSITISIDKSSINPQKVEDKFLNTLIVKIGIPITQNSFIYDTLTTSNHSISIYKYFLDKGFIDGNNLVTSAFNPSNPIEFTVVQLATPELNQQLFNKVRLTLQRGIYYNPILFNTSSSLKFDIKNQKSMISTYSTTVQFHVSITNPTMGVFVSKLYSGVIVSLSVQQDEIIFEGPIDNVNRVLNDKIFFSQHSPMITNKVDNKQENNFIVYIDDGINYSIKKIFSFEQSTNSFIHLKKKLNLKESLQDQVNSKYSESVVPVLEEVSLEFMATTFYDPDNFQLSYQAYLLNSDGVYEQLKSDYWFKFSTQQLRFYGTPPNKMFKERVTIKVDATDGYTTASDTFTLRLDQLPLFYVINLVISILTPLLSILGIYKYRYVIVNYLNFSNTIYSKEVIKAGQIYFKIIPLLGENLMKSQLIADSLIDCIENQNIENQKLLNALQKNLGVYGNRECGINKLISREMNPTEFQSEQLEQIEVSIQKKNNKEMIELQELTIQKLNNVSLKSNYRASICKKICNEGGIVDMTSDEYKNCMIEEVIMIIKNSQINYKFNGKRRQLIQDVNELDDSSSLLHICVYCLLSRYILSLQPDLLFFYDYLKKYSVALNFYTPNDWYKSYLRFNYVLSEQELPTMNEVTQKNFLQLFNFKDDSIKLALETLKQSPKYNQLQEKVNYHNLNINLLKEVLISDALGIVKSKVFHYRRCQGESLLIESQNIQSIEAYRKTGFKQRCCSKQKYFHYTQYGISSNLKLPYWMNLINKQGIIILYGRPQNDDVDNLQIRIVDKKNYIIKTFNIDVLFNKDENINKINLSLGSKLHIQQFGVNQLSSPSITLQTSPQLRTSFRDSQNRRQEPVKPFLIETFKSQQDEVIEGQRITNLCSPKDNNTIFQSEQDSEIRLDDTHNLMYSSKAKKGKQFNL